MDTSLERNKLKKILETLPPGQVSSPSDDAVEKALSKCWDALEGSDDEGMDGYKLVGRMEDVRWDPPLLTFRIERHGGTVMGSVCAEIQEWTVDVEKGTAEHYPWGGKRLVGQRPRPLKVAPIAKEIADLVVTEKNDKRLKWITANHVRVLVSEVIPETSRQTTSGRRKRFWAALEGELKPHGWVLFKRSVYRDNSDEYNRAVETAKSPR